MTQCVPSWELDENSGLPGNDVCAHSNSNSLLPDVPILDYEVAELTWKNGQLAMHGLGPPRVGNKPILTSSPTKYSTWEKPRAGGTLESIVNQATRLPDPKSALYGGGDELVPWFDHHRAMVHPSASASIAMTMDALVPCNNNNIISRNDNQVPSARVMESIPQSGTCVVGSSTRVGSCSGVAAATTFDCGISGARIARVEINSCDTNGSASESATCGIDSRQFTLDTCDKILGATGFTSPSTESPENTSSAKEYTKSTGDDHDSVCHSRPRREKCEEEGKKRGAGKSSLSTKRSRATAIHNQSERKRRDRINQRMKTLQKLVPNSNKTDKASMLDEVIEYLKQLQAQVQIMRMNMSPMMSPLAMQQQLQMSMMQQASPMGMGMGMGMAGMGLPGIGMPGIGIGIMDINNAMGITSGMPPPPTTAFMPASWDNPGNRVLSTPAASVMTDPLSAFLACQSQLMTFDAYSRLAAMYQQQFQHPPGSNSKN